MPSITYWNRLETSPRANDLVPPLAARIHDPLWFLTRQWQIGEFRGEDAGSPAWIEVETMSVRMTAWSTANTLQMIDARVPLEKSVGETLPLDLATSVDLGQMFESSLGDPTLLAPFRVAFPVAAASVADEALGDEELLRFRGVMAGRALDGGSLFHAAVASLPALPAQLVIPPAQQASVLSALQHFVDAVREFFGSAPGVATSAWNPANLEYQYAVEAAGFGHYTVWPGDGGEATWEAFSATSQLPSPSLEAPQRTTITRLPASVRFRGQPANRYWDFDNAAIDPGAIEIERRDVAKLVLSDLLQMHGDEWYVVPLEQQVGTIMRLDAVLVHDVFGTLTLVPPTNGAAWTAFETSGNALAKGILLSPTAEAAVQYSAPIGEVRFVRDDMSTVIWAIEEITTGNLGQPLRGHDRSLRQAAPAAPSGEVMSPRYVLRPPAPKHWTAYLPKRMAGSVMFERVGVAHTPLRIQEQDLRKSGVRVQRFVARSRGFLGHTYTWIAYRKSVASPETSSGPGFDALVSE